MLLLVAREKNKSGAWIVALLESTRRVRQKWEANPLKRLKLEK